MTKLKNKVLNPYAAEPRVCRFQQCPCLHLCFATVCCHTAGRSLSRGRFHKIFGSYAASSRMNHLQNCLIFTSLGFLSGLQWCPSYYGGFTLQLGSHRCRKDTVFLFESVEHAEILLHLLAEKMRHFGGTVTFLCFRRSNHIFSLQALI